MNSKSTKALSPEDLLRRLSLSKFLLKEGKLALERHGTYSHGLATSLFQDATEIFLLTVGMHRNVDLGQNPSFVAVLNKIVALVPIVVHHKYTLLRLNKARVMFKHEGLTTLDRNEVITFAENVTNFLTDVCATELGIDFTGVSLADAIGHRRTQNWISQAESELEAGNIDKALQKASGAMTIYLAHSFRHDPAFKKSRHRRHHWMFPSPRKLYTSNPSIEVRDRNSNLLSKLIQFAKWANEYIEISSDRVHLLARGVDVSAFDKFGAITPRALVMPDGHIRVAEIDAVDSPTVDDVRFCIDTVIDTALALRNNRPPETLGTQYSPLRIPVTCNTNIIVNPQMSELEHIREASLGETLEVHPDFQHFPDSNYLPIIQDGDVAFVSKDCVEQPSIDSVEDANAS